MSVEKESIYFSWQISQITQVPFSLLNLVHTINAQGYKEDINSDHKTKI